MSAMLSDYFFNIDTRGDLHAAEEAAYESWLEQQDIGFLLSNDAGDLLSDALGGVDIRQRVKDLVEAKFNQEMESDRRDYDFDESAIWDV
jgi:hypothetical protein